MKHLKAPTFNHAWFKDAKLPLVKPSILNFANPVTFNVINGHQVVNPYYKEMVVKVTNNKYSRAMDFLIGEFAASSKERNDMLGVPSERGPDYWHQLQAMQLITVKGERQWKTLSDTVKEQYSGPIKKKVLLSATGSQLDSWKLKVRDEITTVNCIHELPVPLNSGGAIHIPIVYQDARILVVDKPFGISAHPTGNSYRYNSLLSLVKSQLGLNYDLWPCHRLDKDTTGALIFAKSKEVCGQMSTLIANKDLMEKVYCVKVNGEFPSHQIVKDYVIPLDLTKPYKYGGIISPPIQAMTEFRLVSFDSVTNTSLVEAKLHTGRRHQIRQHLRNLGFPVVNDPLYGIDAPLSEPMFSHPSQEQFQILKERYSEQHKWKMQNSFPLHVCEDCSHVTYIPSAQFPMNLHAYSYKSVDGKYHFKTKRPSWWN